MGGVLACLVAQTPEPFEEDMKLTIGIINYHTYPFLRNLLRSIHRNPPSFPYEIIVVDNGDKVDVKKLLLSEFPEVKVIKNRINVGYARACNQIYPRAKGEYILYLNPDTVVLKDSLNNLVKFMDEHPEAGAAGAKLLYPDGSLQYSCRHFPNFYNVFFGRQSIFTRYIPNNPITRKFMLTDLDYSKVHRVDWVIGASMILRKKVLEELGGFDERFYLYVEDTDICYRMRKKGWEVYFVPDSVIYHALGVSVKYAPFRAKFYHNLGMYRFYLKHYPIARVLIPVLAMGLLVRISLIGLSELINNTRGRCDGKTKTAILHLGDSDT